MRYSVELYEENERVNFYTLRFEGEEDTEFDKFMLKFPEGCEYDEEMNHILAVLEKIEERGASERNFRYEGNYGDGVGAIPLEVGRLRLYCLRLSDGILILGNGDVKDVEKWQDDPTLTEYAQILKDTSKYIRIRENNGDIGIYGNQLMGNLNFYTNEKE